MYTMIDICEVCRHYIPPGEARPECGSEAECPAPECPLNQARLEQAQRAGTAPAPAAGRQVE